MTVSHRERAAAALLRDAVDDLLAHTPLERLPRVEPFCADILKVADFLAPAADRANGDALLGETVGIRPVKT